MKPGGGRTKGHAFERLVANLLKPFFSNARRGLQYQDGSTCPDVVNTPWHIECKRGKKVNVRKAFRQAQRDRVGEWVPIIVVSKEDREPILVSLSTKDWVSVFKGTGLGLSYLEDCGPCDDDHFITTTWDLFEEDFLIKKYGAIKNG